MKKMNDEHLAGIRRRAQEWSQRGSWADPDARDLAPLDRAALLDHVDELAKQLEDAERRAVAGEEGAARAVAAEKKLAALVVDALTDRLEAMERERDAATMSLDSLIQGSDRARDVELQLVKHQKERADVAERKLATLVAALDAWTLDARRETLFELEVALQAARGES